MDDDYQTTLRSISQQLVTTKELLDQTDSRSFEQVLEGLSAEEAAKLQVSLAYTLASLYYVLMKGAGKDTIGNRDISIEINRIKQYVVKLNGTDRKTTVNVAATKRTISHHLS